MIVLNRKILSSFLLVMFTFYYVNITFFPHSHQVGDKIITHSHFYGGRITTTSQPVHAHSNAELVIINELSLFLALAVALLAVPFTVKAASRHYYIVLAVASCNKPFEPIRQLRAPPVPA